jgi:hypothetical protein
MSYFGRGKPAKTIPGVASGPSYKFPGYRIPAPSAVDPFSGAVVTVFGKKKSMGGGDRRPRKTIGKHQSPTTGGGESSTTRAAGGKGLNAIQITNARGIVCNNVVITADENKKTLVRSLNVPVVEFWTDQITEKLVNKIRTLGTNGTVVGCVAWFSNENVLRSIAESCHRCLFVVNDEDYSGDDSKHKLALYDKLPRFREPLHSAFSHYPSCYLNAMDRNEKGKKYKMSHYEAVRAIGEQTMSNKGPGGGGKKRFANIMHNKFMVFFEKRHIEGREADVPIAIASGSFNVTQNAEGNLENVVYVEDETIAKGGFDYFCDIFVHSKPLRR